ncbi:UDP-glucose flavonoid 3-O-glucosyltransferase 7-like [Nymphaea colorata]|nr:UDP-glucose flavonoid 3-O-glucosyltransferase 7-like [Nymphaea colorata]
MTSSGVEMMLVPFHGQGHIFPCTQLSLQLAARGVTVTVVVPSEVAPSISAACNHPLVRIAELPLPPNPPGAPPQHQFLRSRLMVEPFAELIARRAAPGSSDPPPPICVVIDALVGWAVEICQRHGLPSAVFFTNGTAACALEYIGYHLPLDDLNPDEPVSIEGLPDSLGLTYADLIHKPPGSQMPPPMALPGFNPPPFFPGGGPPGGRRFPPWVPEVESAAVFLFNTCDELERPFIECIAREAKKKAFGVGPLLPPQLWESAGAPLRDGAVRAKKSSGISEEEVEAWLASKRRGSVVFVSFGSEVSPSVPELANLAAGLEESGQPFIWVIQPNARRAGSPFGAPPEDPWSGVVPEGFEKRVEGRGLVVRGWAPQLLILSHPSTGGFISHCGWNSTLEALVQGVPILGWPIRGDQHQTAILVANYLRVGFKIRSARGREVSKEDVVKGLEKLMGNAEVKKRASEIKSIFSSGFPASSSASLDAFVHLFRRE